MKDSIMNKKKFFLFAAMCSVTALTSCVKEVMNEETAGELTSRLSVITRAPLDGASTIALPVQIYVFGSDGKCAAVQTVDGDGAFPAIALAEGTYDVYALGGVDATRYTLPSQEEIRSTTEIQLQDGKVLDDLMTASAHVSLTDGEEEQLTLSMERKVMLLSGVTITNVPEDVLAVSISILPLYESVLLNGTLSGTNGNHTALLQCQADGTTWKSASNIYLFPPSQKPTISVSFQREDGTKSYAYNCQDDISANYKLTIEGSYQAEQGVVVSGTVEGVSWDGEKTISLTFDEKTGTVTGQENAGESNGNENGNENGGGTQMASLKVGDIYKDCYVLAVEGNEVTLLSSIEEKGITVSGDTQASALSKINSKLEKWNIDGIDGEWEMPDESMMTTFLTGKDSSNHYFFLSSDGDIKLIFVNKGKISYANSLANSAYLRPVTTITISE